MYSGKIQNPRSEGECEGREYSFPQGIYQASLMKVLYKVMKIIKNREKEDRNYISFKNS